MKSTSALRLFVSWVLTAISGNHVFLLHVFDIKHINEINGLQMSRNSTFEIATMAFVDRLGAIKDVLALWKSGLTNGSHFSLDHLDKRE